MRLTSVVSEAWRNTISGASHAALLATLGAFILGGLATAETLAVNALTARTAEHIAAGGDVTVITTTPPQMELTPSTAPPAKPSHTSPGSRPPGPCAAPTRRSPSLRSPAIPSPSPKQAPVCATCSTSTVPPPPQDSGSPTLSQPPQVPTRRAPSQQP